MRAASGGATAFSFDAALKAQALEDQPSFKTSQEAAGEQEHAASSQQAGASQQAGEGGAAVSAALPRDAPEASNAAPAEPPAEEDESGMYD